MMFQFSTKKSILLRSWFYYLSKHPRKFLGHEGANRIKVVSWALISMSRPLIMQSAFSYRELTTNGESGPKQLHEAIH